jgi:DNA repair protein RecO (recombination protein O)
MEYQYQGIVLGKKDVGEVDRIYTVYTREKGKIRVLGKGVRKPNAKLAGSLETITRGEFFIAKNRGMGKIVGVLVENSFLGIKKELDSMVAAFFVFRIFSKIVSEEEGDGDLFDLLERYLKLLDKNSNKDELIDIFTIGFLFKAMDGLGYRLEVNRCVHCEKKLVLEANHLSISRGGILCLDCHKHEHEKMAIDNELIKLIRILLGNKLEQLVKIRITLKNRQKLKIIINGVLNWFSDDDSRFS